MITGNTFKILQEAIKYSNEHPKSTVYTNSVEVKNYFAQFHPNTKVELMKTPKLDITKATTIEIDQMRKVIINHSPYWGLYDSK